KALTSSPRSWGRREISPGTLTTRSVGFSSSIVTPPLVLSLFLPPGCRLEPPGTRRKSSMVPDCRGIDHRQGAGLDRLGQFRPGSATVSCFLSLCVADQPGDFGSNGRWQGFPALDHFGEIRRECGNSVGRSKVNRPQACGFLAFASTSIEISRSFYLVGSEA